MAAIRVAVGDVVATASMNDALTCRMGSANVVANSAGNTTTTAASIMTLSVNVVSGKTYAVQFMGRISVGTAGDTSVVRIKTVSASGTDLNSTQMWGGTTDAGGFECSCYAEYTAPSTATVVFVVTLERAVTGAATATTLKASATGPAYLYCDYLGI